MGEAGLGTAVECSITSRLNLQVTRSDARGSVVDLSRRRDC
jgi:hypothetical protein